MKSGFVSIIGRPNVGKSTLLNRLVNAHVAITSNKPGTTRSIIQGIYNEDNLQIVFVDTPGMGRTINKLDKVLNKQAASASKDVDAILFVVDAKGGLGKGDQKIIDTFREDIPVILVLNKIDGMTKEQVLEQIIAYKDLYSFAAIIPVSALTGDNTQEVLDAVIPYLSDEVKFFEDDILTSSSTSFMISEYVREKLFRHLEEEIPYSVTCVTTSYEEELKLVHVCVDIIVDRPALKKIIIGHNGEMLKQVGTEARHDIEELVGKKVFLELYVKCVDNWRDKDSYLKDNGFFDF